MTTETITTRAFVQCLACYNAGRLNGSWCEPDEAAEYRCPRDPTHEEYACHDIEGLPSYFVSEMSPLVFSELCELLDGLNESYQPLEAFAAYCANLGISTPDSSDLNAFDEIYNGEWDSEEEFAEDLANDICESAEHRRLLTQHVWPYSYIDWERAASDLFMSDYWSHRTSTGTYYVFRND